MRLDRAGRTDGPIIAAIGPRGFRVDDGYYSALLLTPERADGWSPPALADLAEADLSPLLALDPMAEFLLLGTGPELRRPPRELVAALEERNVTIEPMDSRAAARAWAVLRGEGRWIGAALYPLG